MKKKDNKKDRDKSAENREKKERRERAGQIIGFWDNYLVAILLAVIFALFCSARTGWFLVIAFGAAPLVSLVYTLVSRKFLKLDFSCETGHFSKNEKCRFRVRAYNRSLLPTPVVEVVPLVPVNFDSEEEKIFFSVLPRSKKEMETVLTARISGLSQVKIKEVRIHDILGIFSFRIKTDETESFKSGILPDIGDVKDDSNIIRSAVSILSSYDDNDESTENSSFSFTGVPGYDSREYIPGDPIKRINWKLSAKRDSLFVRLDDSISASHIAVILDSTYYEEVEERAYALNAERAIENSLGAAFRLLMRGYTVEYLWCDKGGWCMQTVNDSKDISRIQDILSEYSFEKRQEKDFPFDAAGSLKIRAAVFVSPSPEADIPEFTSDKIEIRRFSTHEEEG